MGPILTRLYQKRIECYLGTPKGILETEPAATMGTGPEPTTKQRREQWQREAM